MSFHHALMDFLLWCLAILWLCQFLAEQLQKTPRRKRRLGPPSPQCERTGQFEVQMNQLTRRGF